jgi:hypothetical protein
MVVSIVSLVLCCFPAGIVGTVLGKMELNAIQEGRAPRAGETMAKVGFYLGIVSIAVSALLIVLKLLGAFAGFLSGSYNY